jgi:hypothetical protein
MVRTRVREPGTRQGWTCVKEVRVTRQKSPSYGTKTARTAFTAIQVRDREELSKANCAKGGGW